MSHSPFKDPLTKETQVLKEYNKFQEWEFINRRDLKVRSGNVAINLEPLY